MVKFCEAIFVKLILLTLLTFKVNSFGDNDPFM